MFYPIAPSSYDAAMIPPEHIHVSKVAPAVEASRALGVTETELTALGLGRDVMNDPDGVVSAQVTYAHFEWMHRREDYVPFLIDAVQRHGLPNLGVVGMAAKTLQTVGEVMVCHQRFQHLINRTARYVFEEQGDRFVVWQDRVGDHPGLERVSVYTLLVAARLLSLLSAEPVRAVAWGTRQTSIPEVERAALEQAIQLPLQTGVQRTFLALPRSLLGAPVRTADPELADYFTGLLKRSPGASEAETGLLMDLRRAIAQELATGTASGAVIGRRLGMSQRTLQRRLRAENLTFATVLADTRRELAEDYLVDPSLNMAEVAWLLGYREETSFYRSFRRWTGMTPTTFRQRHSGVGPGASLT